MVLIKNESLKRLNWPLGIIEEVFPGKDGKIRLVKLRTTYGTPMRSIQRLFHTEMQESTDEDIAVKDKMKKKLQENKI